ncbi:hypothetical protein AHiyo1_14190 [Arthrobacter sp. Hiyo1]|nr:hypothetical protein AHiyo1_14190 [Arthrobacter sp. Hiyo1]
MQAVGILGGVDTLEDGVGVQVLGQWQLHDVTVAGGVRIEFVDEVLDLRLGGVRRKLTLDRVHPDLHGLLVLHGHVKLRSRVRTDEHSGNARSYAAGPQGSYTLSQLRLDGGSGGLAVKDLRGLRHGRVHHCSCCGYSGKSAASLSTRACNASTSVAEPAFNAEAMISQPRRTRWLRSRG